MTDIVRKRKAKRLLGRYLRGNWRGVPLKFRADMERLFKERGWR